MKTVNTEIFVLNFYVYDFIHVKMWKMYVCMHIWCLKSFNKSCYRITRKVSWETQNEWIFIHPNLRIFTSYPSVFDLMIVSRSQIYNLSPTSPLLSLPRVCVCVWVYAVHRYVMWKCAPRGLQKTSGTVLCHSPPHFPETSLLNPEPGHWQASSGDATQC